MIVWRYRWWWETHKMKRMRGTETRECYLLLFLIEKKNEKNQDIRPTWLMVYSLNCDVYYPFLLVSFTKKKNLRVRRVPRNVLRTLSLISIYTSAWRSNSLIFNLRLFLFLDSHWSHALSLSPSLLSLSLSRARDVRECGNVCDVSLLSVRSNMWVVNVN